MKNSFDLFQPSPQNEATLNQLTVQQLDKAESNVQPSVSRRILSLQTYLTNIRTYCFVRTENKMWFCKELGRTIPSTPQGKPNKELLAQEISSHPDFFQSR